VVFRSGREDCSSANAPNTADLHLFPEPFMSRTELMAYYADTGSTVGGGFGFNEDQVREILNMNYGNPF